MNARQKIVTENWQFCMQHLDLLNDWETKFVTSLDPRWKLTTGQFNKLSSITLDLGKKVFAEKNEL